MELLNPKGENKGIGVMKHYLDFLDFFLGILAPAFRASLNAIATACFGLVTSGPFLEPL